MVDFNTLPLTLGCTFDILPAKADRFFVAVEDGSLTPLARYANGEPRYFTRDHASRVMAGLASVQDGALAGRLAPDWEHLVRVFCCE
jgi:hypothetical protein